MNALAMAALERDKDPELFRAIYDLLQRTFQENRVETGRGYNASRACQSRYRHGAMESVSRDILKTSTEGFGRLEEAGRLDLTYEWLDLNPRWRFPIGVWARAWQRLQAVFDRLQAVFDRMHGTTAYRAETFSQL